MNGMIFLCAAVATLSICAAPVPPLRIQQNRFNDRLQMQQSALQQRRQSRLPEQPVQLRPERSDLRQNPTPVERLQINLENHQLQQLHRQQQIAPPPSPEKRSSTAVQESNFTSKH